MDAASPDPPATRPPLAWAAAAFFASGLAALVYQVAWQRILALHSGVGIYSIAMIVAAFMAGLGIGSHLGGVLSGRLTSRRALAAFGLLELLTALFGLASVPLYYDLLYQRGHQLYASPWAAGLLHLAALVPPTVLMGMTLPFLVRALVPDAESAGRTIGLLYGINMLGAATGAMLAPWVLIRQVGLSGAVETAAGANALAALVTLLLARRAVAPAQDEDAVRADARNGEPSRSFGSWMVLYAASGFVALSLEILWFRLLDVATRSTAFTFGTLLSVYLFGSTVGCLLGAGWSRRLRRPLRAFLLCQCGLLLYSGLAVVALVWLPPTLPGLASLHAYWKAGSTFQLGRIWDLHLLLGLYLALPLVLFGVPTVLMGLSFPVLQRAVQDDPTTCGRKVGFLQAANITGCAAGSLVVGLAGLGWLGTAGSLRALVACGLVFPITGLRAYGPRSPFAPLAVAMALLVAALPSNERLWPGILGEVKPPTIVDEDATSVVAVLRGQAAWSVAVNGKRHSWLPFGGVHTRLGAIPAVMHKAPRDVAIIGLGSGDTAWAAGCRTETRSITVFEIAARQHLLLERLARSEDLPELASFLRDPRLRIVAADGRHALGQPGPLYDLIEADALWPYAAYSGNLYSVEFFRACARRLKPGGLMCTWAPTSRVVATFLAAFPHVVGPRNRSLLIGANEPIAIAPEAWRARLLSPAVASYLGARRVEDLLGPLDKLRVVEAAPDDRPSLNDDLHPRDEFLAP